MKKNSLFIFILKNVAAAIVLIAIIIWITFKAIDRYTDHGVAEQVPDLRGAYVEEADVLLAAQGLYPQVIDSVYMRDKRLGTVVDQTPQPGATIKRNRPVYLIINANEVRKTDLPPVNDISSRQATAMLTASGLHVEAIEYVPSEYEDLVINVKYRGESVAPGTKIPEGENVVLVVGRGKGDRKTIIPKLMGMTTEEARQALVSTSLTLGATHYDGHDTEVDNYTVYRQEPAGGDILPDGTTVNIWLTADTLLIQESKYQNTYTNTDQDEEFF